MSKFEAFLDSGKKRNYVLLALISSIVLLPLLGSYPLLGQWEPHYGRVVDEMFRNNSWDWFLNPIYLGKENFWSKPIFCFWMVFPFYKIFGHSELAMRIPFALNGIFGVLLTYYITEKMFSSKARAFWAALIMLLTPYYYMISRQFMWDITTTVFLFGAVGLLYLGIRDVNKKYTRVAYVFLGIVMLTKGLMAILIPGGIFFLWMIVQKDRAKAIDILKKLRLFEGLIIFLIVSGPWYLYMAIKHGMPFFKEFFIENHFGRVAGTIDKPDAPFEFYVWQLCLGAFPWIGLFIPAFYINVKKSEKKEEELFTILSFFFIFLFFTLSATKFPHYIFPAIPFFAIIVASIFSEHIKGKGSELILFTSMMGAMTLGLITKDIGTGMNYRDFLYIITTHKVQNWFGRVFDMRPWLYYLIPPIILSVLLPLVVKSLSFVIKPLKTKVECSLKASAILFALSAFAFSAYINYNWVPNMLEVFSSQKMAEKFLSEKKPGDIIIDFDNWKNRGLIYYIGTENNLLRLTRPEQVAKTIETHPENTVYITTKINKIPELRAIISSKPGIPLERIMDDEVDTYKEIELLKASMKDKDKMDDSWKKGLIQESDIPKNINKLGGTLGNGSVEFIGYTINKTYFKQSEPIEITLYYKTMKKLDSNYHFFFHLDVADGALPYSIKLDEYPLKGFYPATKWEEGTIVKQTFETDVPSKHPGGGIKIYGGLYEGGNRLPVDQDNFNDGENRFILGQFRIRIK